MVWVIHTFLITLHDRLNRISLVGRIILPLSIILLVFWVAFSLNFLWIFVVVRVARLEVRVWILAIILHIVHLENILRVNIELFLRLRGLRMRHISWKIIFYKIFTASNDTFCLCLLFSLILICLSIFLIYKFPFFYFFQWQFILWRFKLFKFCRWNHVFNIYRDRFFNIWRILGNPPMSLIS